MMNFIPSIAKAIAAAATSFAGSFFTAYADQKVDTGEWVYIAAATVVAACTVWAMPNVTIEKESES
jgi:hypothetical protein